MGVSIDESGLINNEAGPKDNPREREYFEHQIKHTEDGKNCEITGWTIEGDVPQGITIDGNGVVKGTIEGMWEQASTSTKKPNEYVEFDCRNYPATNGRFEPNEYDFVFTTTVSWIEKDGAGNCVVPGTTSETHIVKLVKDWDGDVLLLFREILDGGDGRLPFHCKYSGPTNKEQCEIIGGEWNEEYEYCSIGTPQTQSKCEELGGTWENGMCNLALIQEQNQCEIIGGKWTKNSVILNGVEYTNGDDYLNAAGYAGKISKLNGI